MLPITVLHTFHSALKCCFWTTKTKSSQVITVKVFHSGIPMNRKSHGKSTISNSSSPFALPPLSSAINTPTELRTIFNRWIHIWARDNMHYYNHDLWFLVKSMKMDFDIMQYVLSLDKKSEGFWKLDFSKN